MSVGILLPGQGSQHAGMADPWIEHPVGRAVLEEASEALGEDVVALCRDPSRLADTAAVQPALVACDVAAAEVLGAFGLRPAVAAGHSVGEYAALVVTGAIPLAPAIRAVAERGRAMAEASRESPGAMTALIGLGPNDADEVSTVAGRGGVLAVANLNSPTQTVLSGSRDAVERAEDMARSRGAKAVRLKVAGAFHSPLMRPAVQPVRAAVARIPFEPPRVPVVPNGSAEPETRPSVLRDLLSRHVTSAVRWERSMRAMADMGVDLFVETGPGDVLAKLAKRCVQGARAVSVNDPDQAEALAAAMEARHAG